MSEILTFFIYLGVTAGVTYLVRMIPLVFFKRRIRSRFVRSFLYYVPYTVLAVMTFPAVFYSTGSLASALVGTAVGILLALLRRGLVTVAAGSVAAVLLTELIMEYLIA